MTSKELLTRGQDKLQMPLHFIVQHFRVHHLAGCKSTLRIQIKKRIVRVPAASRRGFSEAFGQKV
jgi:hypothetical protein